MFVVDLRDQKRNIVIHSIARRITYHGISGTCESLFGLTGDVRWQTREHDVAVERRLDRSNLDLADRLGNLAPQLPRTPTFAEAGYPTIEAYASFSVAAPAGTPPAIVQRLSAEIIRVMKSPAFREKLDAQGLIPIFDTPDEFAASLKKERQMWAEVIRRNNITAE